jgi:hypothetical protein
MGRLVSVVVAVGFLSLAALPASAGTTAYVTFRTPSKNIYCAYYSPPAFMRCDIRSGLHPRPSGKCVEGDYGQSVGMTASGRAHVLCISDTVYNPTARVLPYGSSWSGGGFRCVSRSAGLTCTSSRGHGFFLSRESWKVY